MKTRITFILPSIKPELWLSIHANLTEKLIRYEWDMVCIGPKGIEGNVPKNLHFKESQQRPTACVQRAAEWGKGDLICIICDDAKFITSLDDEVDRFLTLDTKKDLLCLKYTEGVNHSGNPKDFGDFYWTVWYHPWHHAPGVPMHFNVGPISLMDRNMFIDLGGIDCNFETMSLAPHDFAYRVQHNGGKVVMSKDIVITLDHAPATTGHRVIEEAFIQGDLPYYRAIYAKPLDPPRIKISFLNHYDYTGPWERRFK